MQPPPQQLGQDPSSAVVLYGPGDELNGDPRPSSSVQLYLRDISTIPLLSAVEEIELGQQIECGKESFDTLTNCATLPDQDLAELERRVARGEMARRQLLEANLRLVVSVARKYANRGVALVDLIQEGNIGLSRAVDKYEWRRGFRFSTYAYWWIRQAMTRAIIEQRCIRVPSHSAKLVGDVYKAVRDLQQELGREPRVSQVAQRLGCSEERIKEMLSSAKQPVSLDAPLGGDQSLSTIGDLIADPTALSPHDLAAQAMLKGQIQEAMLVLSARERQVLSLRYGLSGTPPQGLGEIARRLGVTPERARQIESSALAKLRQEGLRSHLRDYLDVHVPVSERKGVPAAVPTPSRQYLRDVLSLRREPVTHAW
jgi:RNA polymerase primary sigma factor